MKTEAFTEDTHHLPAASRYSQDNNAGFTLLEIMVALSIIAVALIAVFRLYTQTVSMNTLLRFNTHAPLLAQTKLMELENASIEDLMDDQGAFGEQFENYTWRTTIQSVESDLLEQIADDLKKIDLRVSFNEGELVYRVSVYRFLRQQ